MSLQDPNGMRPSAQNVEREDGHVPVLAGEVLEFLVAADGSLQIDGTVGGGGHTERILEATSPDDRLLGLDADGAAVARVARRLARFGDRLVLRQANFRDLGTVAPDAGFGQVDGLLLDLGLDRKSTRLNSSHLVISY